MLKPNHRSEIRNRNRWPCQFVIQICENITASIPDQQIFFNAAVLYAENVLYTGYNMTISIVYRWRDYRNLKQRTCTFRFRGKRN